MFYKKGLRRKNIISLLITTFLTFLIFSCAQAPVKKEVAGIIEEESTQIESDLNALPGQGLTGPGDINDRLVKDIYFEKVKDRPLSTRLIATLTKDVEYFQRKKPVKLKRNSFLRCQQKRKKLQRKNLACTFHRLKHN